MGGWRVAPPGAFARRRHDAKYLVMAMGQSPWSFVMESIQNEMTTGNCSPSDNHRRGLARAHDPAGQGARIVHAVRTGLLWENIRRAVCVMRATSPRARLRFEDFFAALFRRGRGRLLCSRTPSPALFTRRAVRGSSLAGRAENWLRSLAASILWDRSRACSDGLPRRRSAACRRSVVAAFPSR